MKISRLALFTSIFLTALLCACSENDSANANSVNTNVSSAVRTSSDAVQQDNVEGLGNIVKLNITPDEATYSETELSNQNGDGRTSNGKRLVAVLKFSAEKAGEVAAQAEKYKPAVSSEISAENWFPAELVAQSQLTGDESLKGVTYAANDFFQAPYGNGKLTRINDTDYFVLELTTF